MSKQKRLKGCMQRAGCRTVVFYQQNKGSVWLNFLNWSESQKKTNGYCDMTLGALLWLTIPSKTIIKITCVGPDGLTWARNELRFSINHEFHAVTKTNNSKAIFDMWVELMLVPNGFRPSTRTNILNSNGNNRKMSHLAECPLLNFHYLLLFLLLLLLLSLTKRFAFAFKLSIIPFLNKRLHPFLLFPVSVKCTWW